MLKAYKYRLYPDNEQKEYFANVFGCVRFVYNKMLADRIRIYETNSDEKEPTPAKYKAEFEWLKKVDSLALANAQLNLRSAYKKFFREGSGFPKFKTKKTNRHSYTTNNQGGTIKIVGDSVKLPKLKTLIKFRQHRVFDGLIKSATVSLTPSGEYYISILVETTHIPHNPTGNHVGVDLGITDIAILSNGVKFDNPRFLRKSSKKLAKEQRKLSKMKRGSNNYNKQRIRVAKIHQHIVNQRKNYLHNITTYIIKNYDIVAIEDLSSSNLMQNRRLAKAIADVSWFEFQRQLHYKAEWNCKQIVKISRWFPSSQICSACGLQSGKKPLHIRHWECECGIQHDRDINASKNILTEGKRILGM